LEEVGDIFFAGHCVDIVRRAKAEAVDFRRTFVRLGFLLRGKYCLVCPNEFKRWGAPVEAR
jgi:hypothetical protein